MALITTAGSGNWSSTTPNAPWPSGTKPTTGDTVAIAAGHTVTLDEDTAVLGAAGIINVSGSNTSVLDISGTRIINGNVSYSGTSTNGLITLTTGGQVTINGQLTNSSSGYAMVVTGSGVYHVTNVGGTALLNTSSGRCISSVSTGTCTVTGAVIDSGTGYCIAHTTGAGTISVSGDVTSESSGTAISVNGGQVTINGKILSRRSNVGVGALVVTTSGTATWIGSWSYATGEYVYVTVTTSSGALILGTVDTPLSLTNADAVVVIIARVGTVDNTYFTHTRTTAASQFAFVGSAAFTDTGPTLPAAGNVIEGSGTYGYADTLVTPDYHEATTGEVVDGTAFGAASALTGTYPTTAASQAAQLATDQAAVLAAAASIKDDTTILGQAGTYDFTAAIAAGYADGEAAQLAADIAFLLANQDEIVSNDADILSEFAVTGTYPSPDEIAAAMWDDTTSPDRSLTG